MASRSIRAPPASRSKEGDDDPARLDPAERQPRRVPRLARRRHPQFLKLLLQAAGKGLGGQGPQALGAPAPPRAFGRDIAEHQRRARQARARHRPLDPQLPARSPTSSAATTRAGRLRRLLRRRARLFATSRPRSGARCGSCPATLRGDHAVRWRAANRFALQLGPALSELIPAAQGAGSGPAPDPAALPQDGRPDPGPDPALHARRCRRRSAPDAGREAARRQTTTGPQQQRSRDLNCCFNALAYNPPGSARRATSSTLPWLNHDTNAIFFTQDADGPLRRGLVLVTCATADAAELT